MAGSRRDKPSDFTQSTPAVVLRLLGLKISAWKIEQARRRKPSPETDLGSGSTPAGAQDIEICIN